MSALQALATRARALAGASLVLAAPTCSPDNDPLDSLATSNGTNPGSGNMSGDPTTGATDPTTGGSASGTTGEPAPTRADCEKYLDCVAVATPEALPAAQMGFGPDGTCWQGSIESQLQCIDACVSGLESLHQLYPDIAACAECVEDAECSAGQHCVAGQCSAPFCGDGFVDVDAGEICDEGCAPSGCDKGPFPCNPFTDAGCAADEQCSLDYWTCVPDNFPPLGDGHACDPNANNFCGHGLVCADPDLINGCQSAGCCTLLCDLLAPNECPNGRVCIDTYGAGTIVGVCALP